MKEQALVTLQAEPEPLEIDVTRMAILVIDMQNAFARKGGLFDLWGHDLSNIQAKKRLSLVAHMPFRQLQVKYSAIECNS